MPSVVKLKDVQKETAYKPPHFIVAYGITQETCNAKDITLIRTLVPPGGRNRRHYHQRGVVGIFIIRGRGCWYAGEKPEELRVEAGDFLYIPEREIHGLYNDSTSEPLELVAAYAGAAGKEDAGYVYVED